MTGDLLIVVLLALFIGFALGRFALARSRQTFRHEHVWAQTASSHLNVYMDNDAKFPVLRTLLLDVCGCGEQRVRTIEGHWEPAQLGLST